MNYQPRTTYAGHTQDIAYLIDQAHGLGAVRVEITDKNGWRVIVDWGGDSGDTVKVVTLGGQVVADFPTGAAR
jgi:hypothetical protein